MFHKKEIERLEQEIADLKAQLKEVENKIPSVVEDGTPWFASKWVQHVAAGGIGMILTAACASFIGVVPWLS